MENLKVFLEQFVHLKPEEWQLMQQHFKPMTLAKGDYYLREGQINRRLGWIIEGVCRYAYVTPAGEEHTKYFVKEGQFLSSIESFNQQKPAQESIQALTDVQLLVMSRDSYMSLFEQLPVWASLVQRITEYAFAKKLKDISPMVVQDARTRYETFLQQQPDVLQRVQLGYVASYLGMTQQSLSRLRRQLAVG
jgi:CRP/FNR family transcriptional regulator, anaerobic regulatory protein